MLELYKEEIETILKTGDVDLLQKLNTYLYKKRIELVKNNYYKYVEYVHRGLWIPAKHLVYVCNIIDKLILGDLYNNGNKITILVITMPPQHGKSQTVTETLPSYYLGKYPNKRVIEVSYGDDLAQRFGRRNKQKIQEFGKELFGIELSKNSGGSEFEILNNTGSMISRGIMAGITGQPGDLIIVDDPIKNRQEADSPTYRDRMWEEYLNSIKTRLSANGVIILIQTRWHTDDLAGRVIETEGNKVMVVNFPCEAEENDILGREVGEPLFPNLGKDSIWLKDFKKSYITQEGNRTWLALFQGRPTSVEGNILKRNWWKFYDEPPELMKIIMSVDAAFKDLETSDFTCIQVWGKREGDIYLLDCINKRMDFPTTLQTILSTKLKYKKCGMILVEDKANGSAIIQMLRRKVPGIVPVNPHGGKASRVNAISHVIESGNVFLPNNVPWVNDFIEQCSSFPNGKNDDMVDAMSQALNRFLFFTANVPDVDSPDDLKIRSRNKSSSMTITTDYLNYGNGW